MTYYNKKIIITPIIRAPHPQDLMPANDDKRSVNNMHFFRTSYQKSTKNNIHDDDEHGNSFHNNFDMNISTSFVCTSKNITSTLSKSHNNCKQFEFKPRLKTNFEFKPKIENKTPLENNVLSILQNQESFVPTNMSQREINNSHLSLCSQLTQNEKQAQSAVKTIKRFKFDKHKNPNKDIHYNQSQNHFSFEKKRENIPQNLDLNTFPNKTDLTADILFSTQLGNKKLTENSMKPVKKFKFEPKSICQLSQKNKNIKNHLCIDNQKNTNYNLNTNGFKPAILFSTELNNNDNLTENTRKAKGKVQFEPKNISQPIIEVNKNIGNHLRINNQQKKNTSLNLNISGIEPLLPNNSNTCDDNNLKLHNFKNGKQQNITNNSEEWFSNIPEELDQILDFSVTNNNSAVEKNIAKNILDSDTLNKIDQLSNLFSNDNDTDQKCQINTNEQLSNKTTILQSKPLNKKPKNQTNMFDLSANAINTTNSKEKFNVSENQIFIGNIKQTKPKLNGSTTINNDFNSIPVSNIKTNTVNLKTKIPDQKIINFCCNENNDIQENNENIVINKDTITDTTIKPMDILNKKNISINIKKNIDVNKSEKINSNLSNNSLNTKNGIGLSCKSTNKINAEVDAKNNKKSKTVKRKGFVLEYDETNTLPPKTVQTKITSLLKPIKNLPETEQNKPDPENANKNYSCALKSCLEISAEKRKITDHFSVVKENKIRDNKKPKVSQPSNAEKSTEEKKHVPKFKKNKFVTPALKQETQENKSKYEICTLNDETIFNLESYLDATPVDEISFNIIFKENCCLLTQTHLGNSNMTNNPIGILIHMFWNYEIIPEIKYPEFYFMKLSKPYWKDISKPRALLRKLFTNSCKKICFKAQLLFILFLDVFEFSIKEIELNWIILDPIVGCWLLDPDHPVTTFSDVLIRLKIRESIKIFTSNPLDNACDMLIQLSAAMKKLQFLLEKKNLFNIFANLEMRILTILAGMEFCGILVNSNILKSFGKVLKEKLDVIENKAYESIGREFQINSTVQLRAILYDELKLDSKNDISIQQTSTLGAKSTSEPMLQLLQKLHPLPGLVLEYRHLKKVKSTYVDAMIQHDKNGTIYSKWEQTSAATGRIACSNPNLQAIPKQPFPLTLFPENSAENEEAKLHLRSAYISRPGYSLLAADFNHIELRVFAHLSQDKSIIKALNEPGDIFINLTRTWLGNSTEDISKKQREETKRLVYATMYGAGPPKIAGILKISIEEATQVIKNFTNKFPSLKEFSRSTIELCQKQGFVRSLSGRCRLFPNIKNPIFKIKAQAERQAINFRIQGSAADICKSAMISTQENLKQFNCKLLLQIHDELVWEVLDEHVSEVWEIVKKVMEDTDTICGKLENFSVPLPVSISVGKNWGEMIE